MAFVTVTEPRPHVKLITLNRPERLNAMSFDVVLPLYEAFREVSAENSCRVVLVTGAGRAFCSGLDLEDSGAPPNIEGLPVSRIAIRAMETMSDLVPAMPAVPQPMIAAINGPA